MEHLQDRLSKWQVMALSRELHHDEAGIGKMCDLMLYAEDAQSAYNAAWILYYLSAEDKRLYLQTVVTQYFVNNKSEIWS